MWTSTTSAVDNYFQGVSLGYRSQGLVGRLNDSLHLLHRNNSLLQTVTIMYWKVFDIQICCVTLHSWSRAQGLTPQPRTHNDTDTLTKCFLRHRSQRHSRPANDQCITYPANVGQSGTLQHYT